MSAPARQWRDRAACRGADPELFFPVAEDGPLRNEQVAAAKAVCAGCVVRAECLAEAMERIPRGVVGGTTEEERRRALRPPQSRRRPARREPIETGLALLEGGRSARDTAQQCGVSVRTAERWAAELRATDQARTEQGRAS